MDFKTYQALALRTFGGKEKKNELFHLVLGLVGEAGEIAEKFKKLVRDNNSDENFIDKEDMQKELGDVLWYVAVLAHYLDIDLNELAEKNIAKLASRLERGKIGGSGDNR